MDERIEEKQKEKYYKNYKKSFKKQGMAMIMLYLQGNIPQDGTQIRELDTAK